MVLQHGARGPAADWGCTWVLEQRRFGCWCLQSETASGLWPPPAVMTEASTRLTCFTLRLKSTGLGPAFNTVTYILHALGLMVPVYLPERAEVWVFISISMKRFQNEPFRIRKHNCRTVLCTSATPGWVVARRHDGQSVSESSTCAAL